MLNEEYSKNRVASKLLCLLCLQSAEKANFLLCNHAVNHTAGIQ